MSGFESVCYFLYLYYLELFFVFIIVLFLVYLLVILPCKSSVFQLLYPSVATVVLYSVLPIDLFLSPVSC